MDLGRICLVGNSSLPLGSSWPLFFNLVLVVSDKAFFARLVDEQKDFCGQPEHDNWQNDGQNTDDGQGEVDEVDVVQSAVVSHLDADVFLGGCDRQRRAVEEQGGEDEPPSDEKSDNGGDDENHHEAGEQRAAAEVLHGLVWNFRKNSSLDTSAHVKSQNENQQLSTFPGLVVPKPFLLKNN